MLTTTTDAPISTCGVHDNIYVHDIVNSMHNVNGPSFALLEREVADRLQRLLAEVSWLHHERVDAVGDGTFEVAVEATDGRRVVLLVHVKSDLRPSAFPAWAAARHRADARSVLALPVVSDRLAELCRLHGWSWIDLAGNCRLDAPGMLHIERLGAPPVQRPPRRSRSLESAAAARVLRVLLSPAHADRDWTQRTLQAATCDQLPAVKPVSLGLVNKVVQHLRDQGFVADVDAGVRLRDPVGLLAAWRERYRLDGRQRLSFFTLSKPKSVSEAIDRLTKELGAVCAYAAFSAAERQAPHVRQPRTWVYVRADLLDRFVCAAEAKSVDSGDNLVVLLPGDPGVFQGFGAMPIDGDVGQLCTDPVQTYLDLAVLGGRGEEAAQAIFAQRLLPTWKKAGLA